jgi:XTP/dITP diphosphohydrolase
MGHVLSGLPCLADDSGLEVEALGGRPGVHSARYAGGMRSDRANIERLLAEMEGVDHRAARFRTVLAFVDHGVEQLFEGCIEGWITAECRGYGGFGYDPIFIPMGKDITFAEMTNTEKSLISHRAIAVNKFVNYYSLMDGHG